MHKIIKMFTITQELLYIAESNKRLENGVIHPSTSMINTVLWSSVTISLVPKWVQNDFAKRKINTKEGIFQYCFYYTASVGKAEITHGKSWKALEKNRKEWRTLQFSGSSVVDPYEEERSPKTDCIICCCRLAKAAIHTYLFSLFFWGVNLCGVFPRQFSPLLFKF